VSSNLILATKVVKQLTKSDKTLALAESITGGGLGMAITEVSGSSKVFAGAIVAYSDIAKIKLLEVPKRLITKHTAVSEEVAKAMALNARELFKADFAISTTGVAGPGKAYGKSAGSVWIAIASRRECFAIELSLSGNRATVRNSTIESALAAFSRIIYP
jgi:PncC family amidohydrolase|tara:strand:+ start:11465 stop:11944 length:480 start_codon:yes stop_codon:yes gene_type:complete